MPARRSALVSLRRSFVTPEGVDLWLELGSAASRAVRLLIDAFLMIVILWWLRLPSFGCRFRE